jgi:hypothetical protein
MRWLSYSAANPTPTPSGSAVQPTTLARATGGITPDRNFSNRNATQTGETNIDKPKLRSLEDIKTQAKEALKAGKQLFIRWSTDPIADQNKHGGRSKDSNTGQMHEGLSAVHFDPDWLDYSDEAFVRVLSEYGFLRIKNSKIRPWLVIGEQVENEYGDKLKDSDGCPVITVRSAQEIDAKFLDEKRTTISPAE